MRNKKFSLFLILFVLFIWLIVFFVIPSKNLISITGSTMGTTYEVKISDRASQSINIISKDIDSIFSSNYYLLTLESSYLDSLDFIRNLQEYKVSILPVCFEPKGLISKSKSQLGNLSESTINNKLNIRLIINVPTE